MSKSQAVAALASPDPTGTKTLRREFERDAYRRWEHVRGEVRRLIENDPRITPDAGVETAIAYAHFRHELESAIEKHVLEPIPPQTALAGHHWTARYLRDAWEHGIALADEYLRRLGYPEPDASPEMRMRQRPHRRGLRRVFIRAYADLEDIAADARKDASRTYDEGLRTERPQRDLISTTDGREDGVNNRLDAIGETRTEDLADVHVIGAVNRAALTRYSQAGVEEVGGMIEVSEDDAASEAFRASASRVVRLQGEDDEELEDPSRSPLLKAAVGALASITGDDEEGIVFEFSTANDDRVCGTCQSLAQSYTLEESLNLRQLPPIHPRCRCFMIPTSFGPRIGAVGVLNG